jgi:ATP-dependent helicase/nuclease subunit B
LKTFLDELAETLVQKHPSNLRNITVVLPGKRPAVFLRKKLIALLGPNHWLPNFRTLADIIEELSEFKRGPQLDILMEFYSVYKQNNNPEETLDKFLNWGPSALNDFNEIDHHLLKASMVLDDLRKIKTIEHWSFNDEELSTDQETFLTFWNELHPLYLAFNKHLKSRGFLYGGALAKDLLLKLPSIETLPAEHFYFAGLNALTPAEIKIIKHFTTSGMATCLWDGDAFYAKDLEQEAGVFLREALAEIGPQDMPTNLSGHPKTIHLVETSSSVAQAKYAMELLSGLKPEEIERTALVLPDEGMLSAVLDSIPENIKGANITMGIPLRSTPISGLVSTFFRLVDRKSGSLRHADLLDFIRHPYFQKDKDKLPFIKLIESKVIEFNLVFMTENSAKKAKMEEESLAFLQPIFIAAKTKNALDALAALEHTMKTISNQFSKDALFSQSCLQFQSVLIQLNRFQQRYPVMESLQEIKQVLMKLLGQEQLDVLGEPLLGLQIMGLLETRVLDFDRIIVFNCNEGVLPKHHFSESFLPSDVRMAYGLPSPGKREAIFAYYFYRLLQRTTEATLLFGEGERTAEKSGEKSRYLLQLAYRFAHHDHVHIKEKVLQMEPGNTPKEEAELLQTPWVKERLQALFESGLSPSAINTWLECPKNFFFKYIMSLGEQDDVEEEMESSTFGSIVHKVLEDGLRGFIDGPVKEKELRVFKKELRSRLMEAIEENYSRSLVQTGENYLSTKVAEKYLDKLIDREIGESQKPNPPILIDVERRMKQLVELQNAPNGQVLIRGTVDRIDLLPEGHRIIDYKTGKVTPYDLKVRSWEELGSKPKALQTLIYAMLLGYEGDLDTKAIQAGIISARSISNDFMALEIEKESWYNQEMDTRLKEWLNDLIGMMTDPKEIIRHETSAEYCQYCVSLGSGE